MTSRLSEGEAAPRNLILETEQIYLDVADDLAQAIENIKAGRLDDVKSAVQAIRELRNAFQNAMNERTRVEKLRKQDSGIASGYALDFDRARVEIARRLARLRDAGGD